MTKPDWQQWVGRTESSVDQAVARPIRALSVTFNTTPYAEPGDRIPNLWHWIFSAHLRSCPRSTRTATPNAEAFFRRCRSTGECGREAA